MRSSGKELKLSAICSAKSVSRTQFKEWERRGLVPGWTRARSGGRGRGRTYLYPAEDAFDAIDRVRQQLDLGVSLDEQARRVQPPWSYTSGQFQIEKTATELVNLATGKMDPVVARSFHWCVKQARELGAFEHTRTISSRREGFRACFRNAQDADEFVAELKIMFQVFRRSGPGNAVMVAFARKRLVDLQFGAELPTPGEAPADEVKKAQREHRRALHEADRDVQIWETWPESMKLFEEGAEPR